MLYNIWMTGNLNYLYVWMHICTHVCLTVGWFDDSWSETDSILYYSLRVQCLRFGFWSAFFLTVFVQYITCLKVLVCIFNFNCRIGQQIVRWGTNQDDDGEFNIQICDREVPQWRNPNENFKQSPSQETWIHCLVEDR